MVAAPIRAGEAAADSTAVPADPETGRAGDAPDQQRPRRRGSHAALRYARPVPRERLEQARKALARCLPALLARFPPGALPGEPPWLVVRPGTERWSGERRALGGVTLRVEDDLAGSVERVLTVLLHRLVHLALARQGHTHADATYAGRHGEAFGRLAEAVGFEVHPDRHLGTGDTRPSAELQNVFAEFALSPEELLLGEPGAALRQFGSGCYPGRKWREHLLPIEVELLGDAAPKPAPPPVPGPPANPGASANGRRPLGRRLAAWLGSRLGRSPLLAAKNGDGRAVSGWVTGWERPAGFPAPRLRLRLVRESDPTLWAYPVLHFDVDRAAWLWRLIEEYDCEALAAIYLDPNHRLIGGQVAHVGNRAWVAADSRRLLAGALLCNAWGMAVGHNHPQGSARPSDGDRSFTCRLAQAAQLLEVELLGHYVLTEGAFERVEE
jgi:hypothetical protein